MEKHFGKVLSVDGEDGHSVLDAYEQYKDTIEYIRWYPCKKRPRMSILSQDNQLDLKYISQIQHKDLNQFSQKKFVLKLGRKRVYQNFSLMITKMIFMKNYHKVLYNILF